MIKRLTSWLLVLTMIVSLIPSTLVTASAADVPAVQAASDGVILPSSYTNEYNVATSGNVTISTGGTYRLTGTTTTTVSVTATVPVTLVLDNVKITGAATSPLDLAAGAQVTLVVLDGTSNVLNCTAKELNDTNEGKTAGIHVPDTASLTIDKKAGEAGTGTLSVKGGYGSAGIGGNAGYGYKNTYYNTPQYGLGSYPKTRYTQNLKNDVGLQGISSYSYGGSVPRNSVSENGMDAAGFGGNAGLTVVNQSWAYFNGLAYDYAQAGFGGAPGLDGKDAEKSGAVTINAGSITVVAISAAGIGGGKGYDGQEGVTGYTGSGYNSGHNPNEPFNRYPQTAANGSGGGGAGGYGGRGGDSGVVTINGGTLGITVSAPTAKSGNTTTSDNQHVKTTQDKIMTAGIGGGPGGWGGAGGAGGPAVSAMGYSPSERWNQSYYGAAGGAGQTGYTGYGGKSDKITITGGVINILGAGVALGDTVSTTDVRIQSSEKSYVWNYNHGTGGGYYGAGAGSGGKRTQPTAITTESEIEVSGGNVTVKNAYGFWGDNAVTAENTDSVFSNAPTATDGGNLRPVILNVKDATTQEIIKDAKIAIPVISTNGYPYDYHAETDANGRAVLWLPPATYTLSGKMVSNAKGCITDPVDVTTEENTAVETTVYLGDSIALSLSSTDKTYFGEQEKPINLLADTSLMQDVTVQTVKWFAESYTSSKEYATVASGDGSTYAYDTGYAGAEALNNAGTITKKTDGVYSLPINQNGHYWVQVEYVKNGKTDKLVSSISVSNLYREFPITVKSYVLDTDTGIKESETEYEALKNADGSVFPSDYGFAFDLNGYKADNTTQSVLLDRQVADYDEVNLVPKSTMATWYDAKLGANDDPFNANATGGYTPIKLTLNQDFLDTTKNVRCDTVASKKDVSKYTIVYTPRDGALDVVTITGKATDAAEPFYTHTRSYTTAIDKDTITAIAWPGYKVIGVKVNGEMRDLDKGEDNSTLNQVTVTNIHGKKGGTKIKTVEFLYENNMTDVTVNAVLNDAKKDTTDATKVSASYTVPVEIGTEKTFVPPTVEGYKCVDSSKGKDYKIPSVAKGDSITFYYEKVDGNVTYQAVVGDTVLWTDKGTVTKGQTPAAKTPDQGVDNYQEDKTVPTKYTITGTNTEYPNPDGKYNGLDDITVTYTYKHRTRKVQVQWMNILNSKVVQTDTPVDSNVGEYASISSTVPTGYTVVGSSTATIFVDGKDETQLTATLYCKPSDKATITIQMFSKKEADKQDDTPFNTVTLAAFYDAEQTVNAPTLLGWKLKTGEDSQKKITPIKGQANTVKFVYEPVYDTIMVKYMEKTLNAPLGDQAYQVQQGQNFSVVAPYVKGYKLADTGLDGQAQAAAWNPTAADLKTNKEHTFYYSMIGAEDLVKVVVYGVSDTNPKDNPLYRYEKLFPVGSDAQKIAAFAQPRKAVKSVTVGDAASTLDQATKEVTVSLDGKQANDTVEVVFTYKSNMATVTINAKDNTDAHNPLPAGVFTPKTVEAEIGYPFTYTAPAIPNYVNVGTSAQNGITVSADGNNVIDFYYEAAPVTGNVTYVAVDGEGNTLAYGAVKKLNKDEEVKADINSIDNYFPAGVTNWTVSTGVEPTITDANGQAVTKYDGKTDITVKFTFQRKTKEIGFKLIDADTGNEINANGKNLKTLAQMGIVTDLTEKAPDLTDLGYAKVDGQVLTVTAADNATEQTVTVFYRKADNTASVDVKLYYMDPDTNGKVLIGSYTVSGVKETVRDIAAPDLTGQGYSNPDEASKPVTFGTTNSIEFLYANVENKVVTVKLWDVTDGTEDGKKKEIAANTITGFKSSYRVLKDQTLTVNAPSIYGYVLADGQEQVITKAYSTIAQADEVININYRAVDVDFVQINVTGQVDGGKPLYNYTDTVPVKAGQKEIQVYNWPGYKVKDNQASVEGSGAPIAVANGKATVTFDKSAKTVNVTVTYVENTADVTIQAFWYKDGSVTTENLDGFQNITVKAEVGTEFTYPAPTLPGYELKETSQQIQVTGANDVYKLYYAKSSGNVTYVAKYNDQVIGSASETLNNGATVETGYEKAPKVENYRVDETISVDVTGAKGGKYNGKDDVTVTYQYKQAMKTVTIKLMDDATHTPIGTIKSDPYPTGKKATIAAPTEAVIDGTNVLEHYHLVTNGTLDRYVLDNDEEQFVYYYYEQTDAPVITVKLLDGKKVINAYTVKGEWGVETEIAAPDLTEQGYNYTGTDSDTRTVMPAKGTNERPVVELHYTAVTFDITVEITPKEAKTALGSTYTFTKAVKKGDAYSVTAPSIPGYTLEGALIQTIDKVEGAQTLTFKYAKTDDVSYVKHTIIGKIDGRGRDVFNYTATVSKSETADTKSTYYAPIQEGYNVNKTQAELPNNENGTVTFIYTASGASITIQHMNSNGSAKLDSVADVTMTGYKLNQTGDTTVTVVAPAVSNYGLVGDTTKQVTLNAGENTVSFNYKQMDTQKVNFILTDTDTQKEIRTVEGVKDTTYTKDTFANDMAALGYTFVKGDDKFNAANGSIAVTEASNGNYTLYYRRATRNVQYKYLDNEGNAIGNVVDNSGNATTARVLEKFEAVAPTIPGYTVTGSLRQVVNSVENITDNLTVTFNYVKKSTGTVTVKHKVDGENPFKSYTVSVSDGEWFSASALSEAELAGKYTFAEGESKKTKTIQAENGRDQEIVFLYNKNFVTVTASYVMNGQTYPYANGTVEVVKGKSAMVNPPAISGYELKGLKVGTDGSETELTYGGWDSSKNALTLSNLDSDTQITYYYQPISQNLGKYQTTITVKDLYEVYTLDERTFTVAKENKEASYDPGAYDGYKLVQYKIDKGDAQEIPANNEYPKVNLNENHTITYIYQLADNTDNKVVVPGADGKLPSPDDVTIKPTNPGEKPKIDGDGTVTIPDGGGTVTTPDGTIEVPGGTTVDKNGTITIPDNKGGTVIDPSKPDGGVDKDTYYYVKYYANGGDGKAYTQLVKKGEQATLKTVAELGFTRDGFTATGWNTNENGLGDSYSGGDQTNGTNLTLFAQWKEEENRQHAYSATVTLDANNGTSQTETQTITSDTTERISANLKANSFTLTDWTFKGWNTAKDSTGTYYEDQAPITLNNGDTETLYAQWIKVGADGSITVPGSDNLPGTSDDVTAKPGAGSTLDRNDKTGEITVPAGGSAVNKNGEIAMPNGGTVKPDGTIIVNNGDDTSTTVKPDGTVEEGSNTFAVIFKSGVESIQNITKYVKTGSSINADADIFNYDGHVFAYWTKDNGEKFVTNAQITEAMTLTAHWYVQKEDGSVVIPAPGGNGEIIVKPDGENKPSVDKDGNVTVPGTGPVETPDGPVVVPDGSVVKPDGSIVKPGTDGSEDKIYPVPTQPDEKPAGIITITYKVGDVENPGKYKPVTQSVKAHSVNVLENQFNVPGKTFLYWTDKDGIRVDPNKTLLTDNVLTAQWKNAGSVVLTIKDGSNVQTMQVDSENEYVLIMRGSWTKKDNDKNYRIPVLVDGNDAKIGDLRWYVDTNSYDTEFGFTNSVLSGDEIVSVNAQNGEIKVKNSGIVRVYCESVSDPSIKFSVILVVPGDFNQDGYVDGDDVDLLVEVASMTVSLTNSKKDVFKKLLGDMDTSNEIDGNDVDYLVELATYEKEI